MIHVRKVDPTYFAALLDGTKPFEVRKEAEGEEPFCVGDYLAVNEYSRGRPRQDPLQRTVPAVPDHLRAAGL